MRAPTRYIAVGILQHQNKILMAQRHEGTYWAGYWEFPGGKIEPGEPVGLAVNREIKEEIGVDVMIRYPWVRTYHQYPTHCVELNFYRITDWRGEPKGCEGQTVRWVTLEEAHQLSPQLPTCDHPLRWLTLPQHFQRFSPTSPELARAQMAAMADQMPPALIFEVSQWSANKAALKDVFDTLLSLCKAQGTLLLVHSQHPRAWWREASGVLLSAEDAIEIDERPLPRTHWVGVSCQLLAQALYARQLDTDFVFINPRAAYEGVNGAEGAGNGGQSPQAAAGAAAPSSTIDENAMWEAFSNIAIEAAQPALADDVPEADFETAQQFGAHGIITL